MSKVDDVLVDFEALNLSVVLGPEVCRGQIVSPCHGPGLEGQILILDGSSPWPCDLTELVQS